jgi:hypothetical protein
MRISRATSSHFTKYFCDIYFEYITPCVVMIHVKSDAIRYTGHAFAATHPMLVGYGLVWLSA